MKQKISEIAIIIPVRNEEETIALTIHAIEEQVTVPHAIYVVDDGVDRDDKTMQVVDSLKHKKYPVKAISFGMNDTHGFCNALKRGILHSSEEYVVFVMADLCDELRLINTMLKYLKNGYDVAVGSRYMKGGKKVGGPFLQGVFSYLVNKSLHRIGNIPTSDISNSFKMYKRYFIEKAMVNVNSNGVECSMELMMHANLLHAKSIDIPTKWIGRSLGQSKFILHKRSYVYCRLYFWILSLQLKNFLFSTVQSIHL